MTFSLPPLEYEYNELEPAIDAQTMELHHKKHHQGYVEKLNNALSGTDSEAKTIEELLVGISALPLSIQSSVRNNGGGHYNHSLFWRTITPEISRESDRPSNGLQQAIEECFGGFKSFKDAFEAKALSQFGSGWAWLLFRENGKLDLTSTANQDNPLMGTIATPVTGTPLLGLDVWEHAYYLRYQNRRADYIKAWWSVVNWNQVAENYEKVRTGQLLL